MKKNKIFGLIVALTAVLTACTDTDYTAIPDYELLGTKWASTCTIKQLKDTFMTKFDQYSDTTSKNAGLFTADLIQSKKDWIFNGIVTSSDVEGNIYKYIIVQEEGAGGQAIKISIDAGSLSGIYPVGQRVSVLCNNLYIGNYAQSPQLGTYYVNKEKFKSNASGSKIYYRIEPGRIAKLISDTHISAYGHPEPSAVKADTMTIAQIRAAGPELFNKLVCIKNAYFTGKGADYGAPAAIAKDEDLIFAPSTNGVGYPQSREIQDGTGSIFISTSEYSKFATTKLPSSGYRGYITALVGWYNDKDVTVSGSKIYHQLTIRGLSDLGKGFEGYHAEIKK